MDGNITSSPVQPSESAASPRVASPLPLAVELRFALCVETCPQCATVFGASLSLYAQKLRDGQPLYCPNGHAVAVAERTEGPAVDPQGMHQLAAELAEMSHRLRCQEAELNTLRAKLGSAGLPDNREVKARCNWLTSQAKRTAQFEPICPLCGRAKLSTAALRNHLYR
ncbi:MAG: hypothetical protein ACM359_16015, partial [Bacillota bacterium]